MSEAERRMSWALSRWAVLAVCLGVAGCRTLPPPPSAPPPAPVPVPVPVPEQIDHYRIDAAQSQVLILVYRDGRMAHLGHNHVISVHELSGEVTVPADRAQSSFTLQFPVAAMTVDEPALRAAEGEDFKAPVDAASIRGTREHMLGEKLLDAAHYPSIKIVCDSLRAEGDHWLAMLQINVRGHASSATVPVELATTPQTLAVNGEFDLTHAQLGLTPYSVALGALRVAESFHVRYRLLAQRIDPSDAGAQNP